MQLYICQDYAGNVYLSDDKDMLPPDAVDFHEIELSKRAPAFISDDPTLTIEIQDYNEIVSIERGKE